MLTTRDEVLSAINQAIRERRLMAIDYWSEGKDRTSSRTVEPYLLVRSRGEWFYVCYCRTSAGTRVFRVATTRRAEGLVERQAVTPCTGDTCVADQPYLDQPWLVHYLLRFGGEAVPLAPAEASTALLDVVERLLERYREPA